ncbi:hypothetical protein yaldo0001_33470 [Yersinia aldovae ATCC 35236]|nr:hypothetical protein yaldo0001_33470 [Yersinia aldovae ATCC 35236]
MGKHQVSYLFFIFLSSFYVKKISLAVKQFLASIDYAYRLGKQNLLTELYCQKKCIRA